MSTAEILCLNGRRPDGLIIARAAKIIRQGGVVVFPTQGLYGLGVAAHNAAAGARLFDLKGRPAGKPLLVLIHERRQLQLLVTHVNKLSVLLMDRFWPGRLTLVLPAKAGLASGLLAADGKIGVRLAGHPVAAALAAAVGEAITGTSANLSGATGCTTVAALDKRLLRQVDLVLDSGALNGIGSTVVDASGTVLRVLRDGAISREQLRAAVPQGVSIECN